VIIRHSLFTRKEALSNIQKILQLREELMNTGCFLEEFQPEQGLMKVSHLKGEDY
jgi:hypothetical protein